MATSFRFRTEWSWQTAGNFPGGTCPFAIWNGSADKVVNVNYLAIQPYQITDRAGPQSIANQWTLYTVTDSTGGRAVTYAKSDTAVANLPAQVRWVVGPQVATVGAAWRRVSLMPHVDPTNVTTSAIQFQYWHGNARMNTSEIVGGGTSDATRLILREGQGIAIWPTQLMTNAAILVTMTVRDVADGTWFTAKCNVLYGAIDQAWLTFFNGAGSGKVYELVAVSVDDVGAGDAISIKAASGRVIRFNQPLADGDSLDAISFDTADSFPGDVLVRRNAQLPDLNGVPVTLIQNQIHGIGFNSAAGVLVGPLLAVANVPSIRPFITQQTHYYSSVGLMPYQGDYEIIALGPSVQSIRLQPGEGVAVLDCHIGIGLDPHNGGAASQFTQYRDPMMRLFSNPYQNLDIAADVSIEDYVAAAAETTTVVIRQPGRTVMRDAPARPTTRIITVAGASTAVPIPFGQRNRFIPGPRERVPTVRTIPLETSVTQQVVVTTIRVTR